jgi:hypothetical protein
MRRTLLGVVLTAATLLALAGQASAATAHVTRSKFSGSFAEALWVSRTATTVTGTQITAVNSRQGPSVTIDQFTINLDSNGNFTGGTETSAGATSGFSFVLRQPLTSASLSGSGLPATTCTYGADSDLIGCTAATIDVSAAWTGQGPISRSVVNDHLKSDGFRFIEHHNGTLRDATATGSVSGITLSAADLVRADLGTAKSGFTTVCIGTSC